MGEIDSERGPRFGARLRALRERAGLTQEELAERAGLTPHAVSALERGTRTHPYPHTVRSLADGLQLPEHERSALIAAVPSRRRSTTPTQDVTAPPQPAPLSPRLVVPPTRLHGRENDLVSLCDIVAGGARLVTLTGPGGVGKTRLVAALSDALADGFPDGVLQVPLASLGDATAVMPTIGRALGLAGTDGPESLELVAAHLQPLSLLLVLDNFEHLLSAAAAVAHLAAACPRLVVLVSSRSPLRVRGEHEYAVVPLALPSPAAATPEELTGSPAGRLLWDRLSEIGPRPALDPDDVPALAGLCHRLAGIPLAIELASGHLRLLTPPDLLARLDHVAASAAARDLPERQRTMRATLDWSYRLLNADQQRVFTLLAAFRGGARLTDIEAVAHSGVGLDPADVLPLLGQLAEHSLLVVRTGADGVQRYDLLEPIAQYARSLLVGSEAERVVRAHAATYVALAERAAVGYERAEQVTWLARTETEEANLLVAVERSLDLGDADSAGRIVWSLWLYWWLRGQVVGGRRRAEQCLTHDLEPHLRSRVNLTAATMSYAAGDLEAAGAYWAEAYRLAAAAQDPEAGSKSIAGTGLAALSAGDLDTAATAFRTSLELGLEAGEAGVWMRSLVHVWLGTVLLLQGQPATAVPEVERGLALARGRGDRLSSYVALYNLSQAAISTGDPVAARTHLEEGIRLSGQTQDMANLAYFLEALAVVEAAEDNPHRVAELIGAAEALRMSVGANVYGYYLPDEERRAEAERQARKALGEDAFDDAVDAARSWEPHAAVRYALDQAH